MNKYPYALCTLGDMFKLIQKGHFDSVVQRYRATRNKEDKKLIPAYTASGVFNERKDSAIESYTQVIACDIDFKDNLHIDFGWLKDRIKKSKSLVAVHHSLGGQGLVAYHAVNNNIPERNAFYFNKLKEFYKGCLDVNLDPSCSNVSRLRFVSSDGSLYISGSLQPFDCPYEEKQVRSENSEYTGTNSIFVVNYIEKIINSGVDITQDYHDWVTIAFALAETFGEDGRQMFHSLSMAHPKYRYGQTDKLFDSAINKEMSNPSSNKATKNSIYAIADKYGIRDKE
jgi:hypothetical protein